jgi:hypothetical protein
MIPIKQTLKKPREKVDEEKNEIEDMEYLKSQVRWYNNTVEKAHGQPCRKCKNRGDRALIINGHFALEMCDCDNAGRG